MKELLKKILRKIGLLDNFTVELTGSPQTVMDKLSKKTDDYQPDLFDIFTFNKKEYKGYIRADKFEIKKSKSFIVSFEHWAEAIGKMKIENDRLINTEIYSIQAYMVVIGFGLTALLFFFIGLAAILSALTTGEIEGLYAGLGILTFMTVFLGLPIYVMKWSVRNLKSDLEDELKNISE
jgi:hypothetical protein